MKTFEITWYTHLNEKHHVTKVRKCETKMDAILKLERHVGSPICVYSNVEVQEKPKETKIEKFLKRFRV